MYAAATSKRFAEFAIMLTTAFVGSTCIAESESGSMALGPVSRPTQAYVAPWGWGYGYRHASTAAEGYLNGTAAVIDALGNYEVNDSQAQIYYQQARSLDRENDLKQTAALLTQKKMWSDASIQERKDCEVRAADGRKRLTEKRATTFRQAYQLSSRELNMQTGQICWPAALQDASFQENRERIDELFRECLGYGGPNADIAQEIVRTIDQWSSSLGKDTTAMPRQDYLAAQKFLMGLKYGAASLAPAA